MYVQHDWLFGLPRLTLDEQEAWLAERLSADPAAADISDEEAEAFFAVSYMLRFASPNARATLWRAFGVRYSGVGEKALRYATPRVLRHWKDPKMKELLLRLLMNTVFGRWPAPGPEGERWTDELIRKAALEGLNVVWLTHVRRRLGRGDDLPSFVDTLYGHALREYRMWLNLARLGLRRIVYADALPGQAQSAAAMGLSAADLREKDRLTGALRHDVRRLEQDRKALMARTERAERQARQLRSQALGEVAAARQALKDEQAAYERALAEQDRRFHLEQKLVRDQVAAARKGFSRALAGVAARSRWEVLAGLHIAVEGMKGNEDLCRLMTESLGGVFVQEGADLSLPAPAGFADLEEALRSVAFRQVQIKCDGLYRRKEGRHGVAVSGFQVHMGQEVICQDTRVVSCGPWAGSLMAEYGAAALALHWLVSAAPPAGSHILIWSDCRALLSRLRRTPAAVKPKTGCMALDAAIRRMLRRLSRQGVQVRFAWVPRDEVHTVDRLCDSTYRNLGWYHRRGSRPSSSVSQFLRSALPLSQ